MGDPLVTVPLGFSEVDFFCEHWYKILSLTTKSFSPAAYLEMYLLLQHTVSIRIHHEEMQIKGCCLDV